MDVAGQRPSNFWTILYQNGHCVIDGMVSSKYSMVNNELLLFDWVQNIGTQSEIVHFFLPFRLTMLEHPPDHAILWIDTPLSNHT